jgi:hypothetical protein
VGADDGAKEIEEQPGVTIGEVHPTLKSTASIVLTLVSGKLLRYE